MINLDPKLLQLFPFSDEPEWTTSQSFMDHAQKVVNALDQAITGLSDEETLFPLLKSLGLLHHRMGV